LVLDQRLSKTLPRPCPCKRFFETDPSHGKRLHGHKKSLGIEILHHKLKPAIYFSDESVVRQIDIVKK
jgi:hypothetical protein